MISLKVLLVSSVTTQTLLPLSTGPNTTEIGVPVEQSAGKERGLGLTNRRRGHGAPREGKRIGAEWATAPEYLARQRGGQFVLDMMRELSSDGGKEELTADTRRASIVALKNNLSGVVKRCPVLGRALAFPDCVWDIVYA